jgi:hypothetical protein
LAGGAVVSAARKASRPAGQAATPSRRYFNDDLSSINPSRSSLIRRAMFFGEQRKGNSRGIKL